MGGKKVIISDNKIIIFYLFVENHFSMKLYSTIGQGIGKNAEGIVDPIKANLKFDNAGFDFDKAKEFTDHWWEKVFDNAVNNLYVNNSSITTYESKEVIFMVRVAVEPKIFNVFVLLLTDTCK